MGGGVPKSEGGSRWDPKMGGVVIRVPPPSPPVDHWDTRIWGGVTMRVPPPPQIVGVSFGVGGQK